VIKLADGHYQLGEAHLCHADARVTCAACLGKGKQGRKKCRECSGSKTQSPADSWGTQNKVRFGWQVIGPSDLEAARECVENPVTPRHGPGVVYFFNDINEEAGE
jgi:hypothetical protein